MVHRMAIFLVLSGLAAAAQTTTLPAETTSPAQAAAQHQPSQRQVTVPAGTEVLLQLRSSIDTKNARVGDGVYCQTTFPVAIDNVIAIPAGTYVKGQIVKVQRAGKIKGRAQILFRFTSMIYPNGYTVDMPGVVHHDSGTSNATVDDEGTITADPQKGKDASTVARGTGIGAAGGAIATGTRGGVLGGAGLGTLAGLATVLLTRGQDVRIEPGTSFKMLLDRPLTVEVTQVDSNRRTFTEVVPRSSGDAKLPSPPANPK